MRMIVHLFLALGLGYLGLVGFTYFSQPSLLYLPNVAGRAVTATPHDIGLEFEDLQLTTADGETLHAWFVPARQAEQTLLFFHGNAGNISHRLDSIALFHELGLNQLILDYRGYGRSTGKTSEDGTYLDAQAAWDYLTGQRGIAPDQVILFGRSLGGAVAVWLAGQVPARALIIESTFTSVPDLAAELYPWLPARLLSRFSYDTRARVSDIEMPLLVIHSPGDEIIPVQHAAAIFRAAREPKGYLEIQGGHNDGFLLNRKPYIAGVSRFLAAFEPKKSS